MELMQGLLSRRSVAPKDMTGEGPSGAELEQILTAGIRVPDHGKLGPWGIITFDKPAQHAFGAIVAERFTQRMPDATPEQVALEAARPARAPLMLVVIASPKEAKVPLWEQHLSAGAVCQNILNACHALGYGARWLTEWIAYDDAILAALGGKKGDRIAGYIYIGKPTETPQERIRPALADVVSPYTVP